MENPVQVRNINKKLTELYGKHLDGRPYFRLAWPADQREKRFGTFTYTTESGIVHRREENVVRERLKYNYLRSKDRWILEMLTFPPKKDIWGPELLGVENGSYECIWCFDFEEYRIPEFDAVQGLIKIALYGGNSEKMTQKDIDALERLDEEREIKENFDFLDELSPDLSHALHHGEAVFNDSTKSLESKTNEKHSSLVLPSAN